MEFIIPHKDIANTMTLELFMRSRFFRDSKILNFPVMLRKFKKASSSYRTDKKMLGQNNE